MNTEFRDILVTRDEVDVCSMPRMAKFVFEGGHDGSRGDYIVKNVLEEIIDGDCEASFDVVRSVRNELRDQEDSTIGAVLEKVIKDSNVRFVGFGDHPGVVNEDFVRRVLNLKSEAGEYSENSQDDLIKALKDMGIVAESPLKAEQEVPKKPENPLLNNVHSFKAASPNMEEWDAYFENISAEEADIEELRVITTLLRTFKISWDGLKEGFQIRLLQEFVLSDNPDKEFVAFVSGKHDVLNLDLFDDNFERLIESTNEHHQSLIISMAYLNERCKNIFDLNSGGLLSSSAADHLDKALNAGNYLLIWNLLHIRKGAHVKPKIGQRKVQKYIQNRCKDNLEFLKAGMPFLKGYIHFLGTENFFNLFPSALKDNDILYHLLFSCSRTRNYYLREYKAVENKELAVVKLLEIFHRMKQDGLESSILVLIRNNKEVANLIFNDIDFVEAMIVRGLKSPVISILNDYGNENKLIKQMESDKAFRVMVFRENLLSENFILRHGGTLLEKIGRNTGYNSSDAMTLLYMFANLQTVEHFEVLAKNQSRCHDSQLLHELARVKLALKERGATREKVRLVMERA